MVAAILKLMIILLNLDQLCKQRLLNIIFKIGHFLLSMDVKKLNSFVKIVDLLTWNKRTKLQTKQQIQIPTAQSSKPHQIYHTFASNNAQHTHQVSIHIHVYIHLIPGMEELLKAVNDIC